MTDPDFGGYPARLIRLGHKLAAHCRGAFDQRQIFCVDLPNHGESPGLDDMSYPAQAVLLADFLCAEVPESPILIGHSMGGKAAMTLALEHQTLLGALVVVDIAPTAYPHTARATGGVNEKP